MVRTVVSWTFSPPMLIRFLRLSRLASRRSMSVDAASILLLRSSLRPTSASMVSMASAGEAAFDAASLTVLEIVGDEVFEEDGGVPSACGWPQRCGR